MASPALPFRAAEEAALRASTALAAAMGGKVRYYVEVEAGAPLPYVVGGQHEIEDVGADCGQAHSIVSTVKWWTKTVGASKGSQVARQMGAAIVAALNAELSIEGHRVVLVEEEAPERYGTDPDQSSWGSVAFRYETAALA